MSHQQEIAERRRQHGENIARATVDAAKRGPHEPPVPMTPHDSREHAPPLGGHSSRNLPRQENPAETWGGSGR